MDSPQHRTGREEAHGPVQLDAELTPAAGQAAVSEHAGLKDGLSKRDGDSGGCHRPVKKYWRHHQEGGGILRGKLDLFYCYNLGTPGSEEIVKTQDTQVIWNSGFSDGGNYLKLLNKEHHVRT